MLTQSSIICTRAEGAQKPAPHVVDKLVFSSEGKRKDLRINHRVRKACRTRYLIISFFHSFLSKNPRFLQALYFISAVSALPKKQRHANFRITTAFSIDFLRKIMYPVSNVNVDYLIFTPALPITR